MAYPWRILGRNLETIPGAQPSGRETIRGLNILGLSVGRAGLFDTLISDPLRRNWGPTHRKVRIEATASLVSPNCTQPAAARATRHLACMCRHDARNRGVEHDPEKARPALDAGWKPVFRKDHAQTMG